MLGGQVAKCLVVTQVVGVDSPNAFLGCFLLGQYLTGEQGETLSLAGQDALCRGQPTRRDASGLGPFKDAASDFHCHWGRAADATEPRGVAGLSVASNCWLRV